jgi:hypothetical protein
MALSSNHTSASILAGIRVVGQVFTRPKRLGLFSARSKQTQKYNVRIRIKSSLHRVKVGRASNLALPGAPSLDKRVGRTGPVGPDRPHPLDIPSLYLSHACCRHRCRRLATAAASAVLTLDRSPLSTLP